jgi:cell division protein FtsB
MKRWFIIFIEIVVVVAFFNSSFGQYLLGDTQEEVSGWFEKIGNYAENEQLSSLRSDLEPHLSRLSEKQQAYMDELTRDKHPMRQFSASYCRGSDINPYVYGETLQVVCEHFSKNKVLFPSKNS